MKTRKTGCMCAALLVLLTAVTSSAAVIGEGVLYKWVGASDASWQTLESYTVDDGNGKQVTPTALPGPDDTVAIIGTASVTNTVIVPDADLEFVGGLGRVGLNSYAEFVLNVQTDSVFSVAINGGSENAKIGGGVEIAWGRNGRFIKRGPGKLTLTASLRYSPSSSWIADYLCKRVIVEEGDLTFDHEPTKAGSAYFPQLEVWKGAVAHIYESDTGLTQITIDGIHGEGTICCNTPTMKTFILNTGTTSDFAGQLTGNLKLEVSATGITVNLRGTNNTFRSLAPTASSTRKYSTIGFIGGSVLPTDPDSLSTNKSVSSGSWYACYKYLGGPGGVCAKTFYWVNVGEVPGWTEIGTLDGGEVGGLTMNASSGIERGATFDRFPMRFVFAGENPIECVFAGKIIQPEDGRGVWNWTETSPIAVVKRGSGIWHFTDNADRKNTGVVAVDAGTLRFDSIAPVGQVCSLGGAVHRYDPELTNTWSESKTAYPYPDTLPQVPYHIRIGHNGTRGTLEYCGTKAVDATAANSRVIAVDGEGALVNATDNAFKYANIITVTNEGPHTLVLGGDTGAANSISNLCPAAGRTLSVKKEGLGSWDLEGSLTNVGAVAVDEGALRIRNPIVAFKYFKMTVKENYGMHLTTAFPGWSNDVNFCQFALYDANGVRHGLNLKASASGGSLACGTARMTRGKSVSGIENMFDPEKVDTTAAVFGSYEKVIVETNENSWVGFELRLEDDCPEIVAFDYVYQSGLTASYTFTDPYMFVLEGSANGTDWSELYATNGLVYHGSNGHRWASEFNVVHGDVAAPRPGKGFFFTQRAVAAHGQYPTALVGAGPISVADGAKLTYEGDVAPIAALSVDLSDAGDGTIAGAQFAETGVLTVTGEVEGLRQVELPLAFEDVDGAANIANWEIVVNGKSGRWDAVFANGRLMIRRKGLVLIVR